MPKMLSNKRNALLLRASTLVLSGLAVLSVAPARAQEAGARGATQVEEVIVTAEKRAENLQQVPIAVQAYTASQLQNAGVEKLTDVMRLAPNLNMVDQNSLSQHIVIRGVGTNEFFGNAPSSVGIYMDEVTLNSSYMSTLGLFDMERVEVLRGPQNSLFGRNTTGGAVNYISKQPKVGDPLGGYAQLTYGKDNLLEAEGAVSIPLGPTAAARVSGKIHHRDGIWNNLSDGDHHYGDEDRYALRGTIVWDPNAETHVTFSAHSAHDDSQAQPQKVTGSLANNPPLRVNDTVAFTSNIDWTNPTLTANLVNIEGINHTTFRWKDIYSGGGQVEKLNVNGAYLKIKHDFQNVSLTSITSYDETHALYEEDNTGTINGPIGLNHDTLVIDMDQYYEQFTQELRLASSDDAARLRWIAGLYYLNEDSTLAQDVRFGANGFPGAHPSANGVTPPSLFDVIPNPYGNTLSFSISKLRDQSVSGYGQADYKINDKLSATIGLRYTYDDKTNPHFLAGAFDKTGIPSATYYDKAFLLAHMVNKPCLFAQGVGNPFQGNCSDDITNRAPLKKGEVGGKIGLQYHFTPDIMAYGSYSRGFKSGKFDLEFLHTNDTPFPQRSLKPETLDALELGFKSTLLDRSLVFNGAFFYNVWKNQQVFNVGVHGPEFNNLPESQIYGAEFEVTWVPAEHWLVNGGLGLLHTELVDVTGMDFALHQGDFQKGHELPLSPKMSANGSVSRSFDIGSNKLVIGTDLRYQSTSKAKFSPQQPIDEYDSRFEMNAHADYTFGDQRQYDLSVFVNNLTAEKYCTELQDLRGVSGSYYCVPNAGQAEWGVQGKATF
jgi:iron complex outermembrane receptor protein